MDLGYFLEFMAGLFTAMAVTVSGWYALVAVLMMILRTTVDEKKHNDE